MRTFTSLDFPIDDYLKRLGLQSTPSSDEDGLRAIQSAQARAIPFENLDVFLKRPIAIDIHSLAEKLIFQSRGGYCFELNGLLEFALKHLGFSLRPLLGRGRYRIEGTDPRTHYFLLVTLDDREWIVDAGFGGPGLQSPIPLEMHRVDTQNGQQFRLIPDETIPQFILQRYQTDAWEDLYSFTKEKIFPVDIDVANFFASSSPTSIFRRHLLCSISGSTAKSSIFDKILFQTPYQLDPSSPADTIIESDTQLSQILTQRFGIKYSTDEVKVIYKGITKA